MLQKVIVNKSGSGSINIRVPLPSKIAKEFGINEKNRTVEINVEGNKIIITKAQEV